MFEAVLVKYVVPALLQPTTHSHLIACLKVTRCDMSRYMTRDCVLYGDMSCVHAIFGCLGNMIVVVRHNM